MAKQGVISLGEALINFLPLGEGENRWQQSPGGAVANVAAGVAKLGLPSTFIGKVGNDTFGKYLDQTLTSYNVDTTYMQWTTDAPTGIMFIQNDKGTQQSISLNHHLYADQFVVTDEKTAPLFTTHKIFHFSSRSMIQPSCRQTTYSAINQAKQQNMLLSFAPNLCTALWDSHEKACETVSSVLFDVDVLVVTKEEVFQLSGASAVTSGIDFLQKEYQIPFIVVDLEKGGYLVAIENEYTTIAPIHVKAIDSTSANDAFVAAVLYQLHEIPKVITSLTIGEASHITRFASFASVLSASSKGAMTSLPSIERVKKYMDGTEFPVS
ncbi:PfkB family carbohydrate kinase [Oceanobacillus halotolerans]|uniref:PfkB family carbohydrate kinase n=1 Tax=Oceanobacillus halotolerans TaxID=2663380 RepID=UPI0013DD45C5|nr:PfkB family carbohydrate kinase [Oceanobacillus halotolerans]